MPLYGYRCSNGHEIELIRPMGVDAISCPCGVESERQAVNRVAHIGRAIVPQDQKTYRQSFSEYREAVDEVADSYSRVNNDRAPSEKVLETDYYKAAKRKAQSQGAAIR